jgi:uncharacterized membrane protein YeaQ/YmgE (transglycosylase-associated protein family)
MGFLAWIVVGLIAGWLAGQVMKGGGYGILVDIILGILGGVLGGWVFGMLGIWPGGGMISSIIVAFVGAVTLVWITRLLKKPEAHFAVSSARKQQIAFGLRAAEPLSFAGTEVTSPEVLRILLSIGPTEAMHFQTWQDKAGNAKPVTDTDPITGSTV